MINENEQNQFDAVITNISSEFIKTVSDFISIYESFKNEATLHDKFSLILISVYQLIMLDISPGCQYAASKRHFFSFIVTCRTFFEIVIQLKWILSLKEVKKEEAIKLFLEFEGVGFKKNGKIVYEWYELLDAVPKFSYRKLSIDLGLDQEGIPFDTSSFCLLEGYKNMSIYDFFSKVAHCNPKFLNDFVGINKEKNLVFKRQHALLCIVGSMTFVNCLAIFSDMFLGNFYKEKHIHVQEKIKEIQMKFEKFVTSCYDLLLKTL